MDQETAEKIRGLTKLCIYLDPKVISRSLRENLTKTCMDRAILLTEIPDPVLKEHFGATDRQLEAIHKIQRSIYFLEKTDLEISCRHLPLRSRGRSEDVNHWLLLSRPDHLTWIEMLARGANVTAWHFAYAVGSVFSNDRELKHPSEKEAVIVPDPDDPRTSFEHRCTCSAMSQLIPAARINEDDRSTFGTRSNRGLPNKRIKLIGNETFYGEEWRFKGALLRELRVRTTLASVAGSWKAMRSALRSWAAFNDVAFKGRDHFPISTEVLSGWITLFDRPTTADKYLMHLNKASAVLDQPQINEFWRANIMKGARKFDPRRSKAFNHAETIEKIVVKLREWGHHELSEFVPIPYLYQLRTQDEGFPIQLGSPDKTIEITWHSYITIEAETVTIWLRKRKNTDHPSSISRRCICAQYPNACGRCAIIRQIHRRASHASTRSRLFPNIKPSNVTIIKKICFDMGLGSFSWHGPRRGRLEDLVKGKDKSNNPNPTMQEAHESGAWSFFARTMVGYLQKNTMNKIHVAATIAAASDSE